MLACTHQVDLWCRCAGALKCAEVLCSLLVQGVTSAFCTYPRGLPLKPATMTAYFKVRTVVALAAALHSTAAACNLLTRTAASACRSG